MDAAHLVSGDQRRLFDGCVKPSSDLVIATLRPLVVVAVLHSLFSF
jgi:hypothetical protein